MKKLFLVTNLEEISLKSLPEKFAFEQNGDHIKISRKDFSLNCRGFFIDKSESNPNNYFLHCILDEGGCLLSTDRENEKNILVDNLRYHFSVYYNGNMIRDGFIAVEQEGKWQLCALRGSLRWKIFSVDSFIDTRIYGKPYVLDEDGIKILKNCGKIILKYNGKTGKILQEILFPSRVAFLEDKNLWATANESIFAIKGEKYGYNFIKIHRGGRISKMFENDLPNVVFLMKEITRNPTFSQDANSIYWIVRNKFPDVICILTDDSRGRKFFSLLRESFLSKEEVAELQVMFSAGHEKHSLN